MPEVNESDMDDTKKIILNLENELARYALSEKSPEAKQATRTCVYHVLLRAITLSKDPTVPVTEIKRLFELAKELIAQAELGDEKDLQQRLDDLINSLVDQSDLSVQFVQFTAKAQGYFDSLSMLISQKEALLAEDLQAIQENISENNKMLKHVSRRRNVFSTILLALVILFVVAFTLLSSTVIIVIMLSNGNAEGVTINRSKSSTGIYYNMRKPPDEMG